MRQFLVNAGPHWLEWAILKNGGLVACCSEEIHDVTLEELMSTKVKPEWARSGARSVTASGHYAYLVVEWCRERNIPAEER